MGQRLDGLDRRIGELLALREELRTLLSEWDARLAATPDGQRAYLLDTLGARPAIERVRWTRGPRLR